ncbi:MAG: S1 RNA-binding domain-containing protein [Desulfurellaceae bacterium]|nr:S1 RNA-binding domain-containing protein [Desulfurellaceae bacterium]
MLNVADEAVNYESTLKNIKGGEIIEGNVISIRGDEVFVDVGLKSEGMVNINEFNEKQVNIGDKVDVVFLNRQNADGFLAISKEAADKIKAWRRILDAYKNGDVLEGRVKERVKGGFRVDLDGLLAFLPGSQVDVDTVVDFDAFVGKTLDLKLINISEEKKNVIVSRKVVIEEAERQKRKEVFEKIKEGTIVEGVVKNITDYGVFVDLGGIDGFMHITDMSWRRVNHPIDLVKKGEKIKLTVIRISDEGREKRIYLGLKQLQENPWLKIAEEFKEGDIITGKIARIADYGVFIEVDEGIEGLVHNNELSWGKKWNNNFNVGDETKAKILHIDPQERRISLSIKRAMPEPWSKVDREFLVNSVVEGAVTGITDFGVFVRLKEGVEGLIHVSDFSWDTLGKPQFNVGDKLKVKVLSVDRERKRISLGLKQLKDDPWSSVNEKYSVNQFIKGKVVSVKDFGAFVVIDSGIEGLVHISEFGGKKVYEGEEVNVRVLRVDEDKRKISLSFRANRSYKR